MSSGSPLGAPVAARDDLGARVRVELVSGRVREAEIEFATGHPSRPLTPTQRFQKWELLGGEDGPEALARALELGEVPLSETIRRLLGDAA